MNRVGEINKNTYGTEMKIIKYVNSSDINIEFLDDYHFVREHTTYTNFKRGNIKNPFDKEIMGKGCVGDGEYLTHYDSRHIHPIYASWASMMRRCYDEQSKDDYLSYYGITEVCNEWLNYQTFAKWYDEHKYETEGRLHLDKDIKYPGNKLYSPYHCMLVPQRINMLFTNKPNDRGLPNGIRREGNRYYAKYNQKELGSANSLEAAYKLYATEKEKVIKQVADEYKERIPKELYDAMYDYKVDINLDKNYTIK